MATCTSGKILRLRIYKPMRHRAVPKLKNDEPLVKIGMPRRRLDTRSRGVKAFASQQSECLLASAVALRGGDADLAKSKVER
jgi:hypothetical protein